MSKYPTETVDLVSRGWYYPEGHPLASGQIEIKYMTAKEENILSSANLIAKGLVIDKLLESLVSKKEVFRDLLIGDKNGVMIASRILGYGKEYPITYSCASCGKTNEQNMDLTSFEAREVEFLPENKGKNKFTFTLPVSKKVLTFKLLTQGDELKIDADLKGLEKVNSEISEELTTRLRHSILEVDGDASAVTNFVENEFLARDSLAFREHVKSITPDIDLSADFKCVHCGDRRRLTVPITAQFFWPEA